MGNIANEASTDLNPTLLEYGSTSRTSLSGEQYTNLVDAGIISRDEVIRSARFGLYSGRKIRLRSLRIHGSDHQRVSVPLYHRPRKESRKPVRTARQSARLSERLQSESSGPPEKRRRCRHSSDIFYARIRKMRKSGYAAETPHNSSRADLQCDGIVRFTGGCGIKEQKIYQ